ncbi:hypothetical protein FB45DRAFT_378755 [Roridomyces roridus]|uniref:Uncharacterized protein n=1 Tax=Roridomyces roridus TaxID=1738132 RepID=A0AAD7B363_9AGAR|nr:hypothetical protein FB45DRAFT_378755 [Roridomyces roridus]
MKKKSRQRSMHDPFDLAGPGRFHFLQMRRKVFRHILPPARMPNGGQRRWLSCLRPNPHHHPNSIHRILSPPNPGRRPCPHSWYKSSGYIASIHVFLRRMRLLAFRRHRKKSLSTSRGYFHGLSWTSRPRGVKRHRVDVGNSPHASSSSWILLRSQDPTHFLRFNSLLTPLSASPQNYASPYLYPHRTLKIPTQAR